MKSVITVIVLSAAVFAAPTSNLKILDTECRNGDAQSCYDIGLIYDKADIVKYDPHKVAFYYDKACNGKITEACYNLGVLYDEGTYGKNGIKRDVAKAAAAYERGCKLGDADSCHQLEHMNR